MSDNIESRLDKKMYALTHRPLFMFALFSSTSMTVLGGVVVATSIPNIETYFHDIPHIDILSKLILTLPALFVMIVAPLSGILLDKFGKLKFLIPSMFVWSISGASAIFWDNIYWILFTRAIFGIATAFVMTSASALVANYYTGKERGAALGLQGFATACGSALFMCIGGFLATYNWRYPFLVYAIGIFLSILAMFVLFEPRAPRVKSHHHDINHAKFSIIPLLPIYFFAFMAMITYYTSPTQIPIFLKNNLGESEIMVGICVSASALAYGLSSLMYPRIAKLFSMRSIYVIGFALMGFGFLLIFLFHNAICVSLGLLLVGAGGGPIITNNSSLLLTKTHTSNIAKAMGILSSVSFFGQFISPFISQPIVRNYGIINLFLIVALSLFAMMCISIVRRV